MHREITEVLAPYVYFSVGLSSAMGSGRVGCSLYSSTFSQTRLACSCFYDHDIQYYECDHGNHWFILILLSAVSACVVERRMTMTAINVYKKVTFDRVILNVCQCIAVLTQSIALTLQLQSVIISGRWPLQRRPDNDSAAVQLYNRRLESTS